MIKSKPLQLWDLWYPQAGATGISFARGRLTATKILIVHAPPASLTVEIRSDKGRRLAYGQDLAQTADRPMAMEHGGNRTLYAHLVVENCADEQMALFGPLPDLSSLPLNAGPVKDPEAAANWKAMSPKDKEAVTRVYVNMGKSIAAYERLLVPGKSRFDQYVEAVANHNNQAANAILTSDEIAGLKLFIGEAHCINCHNGPLFTNNDFHNTGFPIVKNLPKDVGRFKGADQVLADEFNCLSIYSDAQPEQCAELNFLVVEDNDLIRQFKPPSLRNVAERGPYMDAGQFVTLEQVLHHYNTAPKAPSGHSELEPLNLSEEQLGQIIAFLKTLSAPLNVDQKWLSKPN